MDPSCQQGTVQAGGGSIMVWAVFTWGGLGLLVQLNGSLTRNDNVELLGDYLHPFIGFVTQTTMEFLWMTMCHVIVPELC